MDEHKQKIRDLVQNYHRIRQTTEILCHPLNLEDYVIQSTEDVSPPKWHLAHVTWFFETFLLIPYYPAYQVFNPQYQYLFNSYYQGVGEPFPRARRGHLSRPSVETVYAYRHYVDNHLVDFIKTLSLDVYAKVESIIQLGLHHEQQHQELLLMDIKHNFSVDPSFPAYRTASKNKTQSIPSLQFVEQSGGDVDVGYLGNQFCFDNELPRHQCHLTPYAISSRLITNEEYYEFIEDHGYQNPQWWLADGWDVVKKNGWQAPLYWQISNHGIPMIFTLYGLQALDMNEPVAHLSYYEADAYARWRGCRLPTEIEWEHFASNQPHAWDTHLLETDDLQPRQAKPFDSSTKARVQQWWGHLWEWTSSAYASYPGYQPLSGSLGEYNGKFMCNQQVLRGGSFATPESHLRISYRNFYQSDKRWQFCGLRLAQNR